MPRRLLIPLLVSCFAIASSHAADIRHESMGDVDGVLGMNFARLKRGEVVINPMFVSDDMYEVFARVPSSPRLFEADMPLLVTLSALDRRACDRLFLDQNHTFDEMTEFEHHYLGAEVRLRDVQVVFSGNRRSHCTFKEFEVLRSRDELVRLEEEQQNAEQLLVDNGPSSFNFDSDERVAVVRLMSSIVHFTVTPDNELSEQKAIDLCDGRAYIEPRLNRDQVFMIRSELDRVNGRAALINVNVRDGACTAEGVVPTP